MPISKIPQSGQAANTESNKADQATGGAELPINKVTQGGASAQEKSIGDWIRSLLERAAAAKVNAEHGSHQSAGESKLRHEGSDQAPSTSAKASDEIPEQAPSTSGDDIASTSQDEFADDWVLIEHQSVEKEIVKFQAQNIELSEHQRIVIDPISKELIQWFLNNQFQSTKTISQTAMDLFRSPYLITKNGVPIYDEYVKKMVQKEAKDKGLNYDDKLAARLLDELLSELTAPQQTAIHNILNQALLGLLLNYEHQCKKHLPQGNIEQIYRKHLPENSSEKPYGNMPDLRESQFIGSLIEKFYEIDIKQTEGKPPEVEMEMLSWITPEEATEDTVRGINALELTAVPAYEMKLRLSVNPEGLVKITEFYVDLGSLLIPSSTAPINMPL